MAFSISGASFLSQPSPILTEPKNYTIVNSASTFIAPNANASISISTVNYNLGSNFYWAISNVTSNINAYNFVNNTLSGVASIIGTMCYGTNNFSIIPSTTYNVVGLQKFNLDILYGSNNGPTVYSASNISLYGVPVAPTISSTANLNASANIYFCAPTCNGGSTITNYTATSNTGVSSSGTTSPITVTGLTNCVPYTFTVVAYNQYGRGARSASSCVVKPVYLDATLGIFALGCSQGNSGGKLRCRYTYASDTNASASGIARFNSIGISAAGNITNAIITSGGTPSPVGVTTSRDKYTYSGDTNAAGTSSPYSSGSLTGSASGNGTLGIFQLGQVLSPIKTNSTAREKYTYSSDAICSATAASYRNSGGSAMGNSTFGIFSMHGQNSAPIVSGGGHRDKYTYSNDSSSAATSFLAPYGILLSSGAATGNSTFGIQQLGTGFSVPAYTYNPTREKYTYSNDAASSATNASLNSYAAGGAAGTNYFGIFSLGIPNAPTTPNATANRDKYTYSNDSVTSATSASYTNNSGAAASNGVACVNR
jgi:hypothetical protein